MRQILGEKLSGSRIGIEGPITWLLRSPELTPVYFSLLACVKDTVYQASCPHLIYVKDELPLLLKLLIWISYKTYERLARSGYAQSFEKNRTVRTPFTPSTNFKR